MTDKLYFLQPHLSRFECRVLSCTETTDGLFEIVTDRTAFFPEGGGQSSDEGYFIYGGQKLILQGLFERGDDVIHLCTEPLPEGAALTGVLDYKLRFSKMQNHSGEHILSGIAHKLYGCNNVGFHMGK